MIDGDAASGAVVTEMLAGVGLGVRVFARGEEALAALDLDPPALVLLERSLSGMSGLDVCAAVRGHARFGGVPILFLTTDAGTEDVVEAFAAGADDYVVKPFRATELSARLFSLLRRARAIGASR